jgi:E3 ubiquitin-protein ligase HUWE1
MIKPEAEGSISGLATINSQRLYGCQSNVVYGRSQLLDGIFFFLFVAIIIFLLAFVLNYYF